MKISVQRWFGICLNQISRVTQGGFNPLSDISLESTCFQTVENSKSASCIIALVCDTPDWLKGYLLMLETPTSAKQVGMVHK